MLGEVYMLYIGMHAKGGTIALAESRLLEHKDHMIMTTPTLHERVVYVCITLGR